MKTITLTKELLHKLSTHPSGNGFTKKQIMMMGYEYPPYHGWLNDLIGVIVTQEEYDKVFHAGDALRRKNTFKNEKLKHKIGFGWVSNKSAAAQEFSPVDFKTE